MILLASGGDESVRGSVRGGICSSGIVRLRCSKARVGRFAWRVTLSRLTVKSLLEAGNDLY